ncbi:acyl-CoA dehydrogenase family protein [Thalassorhabdomicrobium marinisediminis]|uniref:Acyl-CoA dehydrogenase n=1 Tax=Thalassorhabdomicrobium marinisediminis TaxID=2170577 RepID=A0A2T7FU79_9RHOB|nr:acyl-CoA dehydrogenase family protein [Thalassorhabdomicrobium marinisediminis]PVA05719.1 acyl-CoA dehydrogenase [Thalassorhabdomicrobium marinisediminis]
MEFVFTEEQQMMAEMAQGFLADRCTTADLRKLTDSGDTFDADRWAGLVDLGLLGALVPESAGGLGLGRADVIQIATACGAALLPEPLVDVMGVVLPALNDLGQDALVADVLKGAAHVALVHPDAQLVQDAPRGTHILVMTPEAVTLAGAEEVTLTAQPSIDPARALSSVSMDGGAIIAQDAEAFAQVARSGAAGALFAAAQLLGIAQKAIDISVAFACERQQFGKPIGSYQAIKHHLASAQVAVEFARPVLHAAAAPAATAARIAHAKIACGRAADLATRSAVQVHGGMGYTQETDVHLYLKRALALRRIWGSETDHRNRYAARLETSAFGPDTLFAKEA